MPRPRTTNTILPSESTPTGIDIIGRRALARTGSGGGLATAVTGGGKFVERQADPYAGAGAPLIFDRFPVPVTGGRPTQIGPNTPIGFSLLVDFRGNIYPFASALVIVEYQSGRSEVVYDQAVECGLEDSLKLRGVFGRFSSLNGLSVNGSKKSMKWTVRREGGWPEAPRLVARFTTIWGLTEVEE